ncbi:MAG: class II aldolase/adducin family protein [Sulfolobales archaeon]|nr:class II aldolase/adducin family protein [Sulfolobales archaeon]MCX8185996.1 class II aldolase/adducin family protein [Sulfolobales archaeon]MDW7969253.1 class II aldolase/adducin family protein [Sulfolobales archaeon]
MDPRELLCDVMKTLHDRGLLNVKGGNASIRGKGNYMWITPSKEPKHRLCPDDIILMYFDGRYFGHSPPSIESKMHLYIYKTYSWVNAVVHAHSPLTTLVFDLGLDVNVSDFVESMVSMPCVGVVDRLPPGSDELARSVRDAVGKCPVVALRGHGVVSVSKDIYSALNAVEALEDLSKAILFKNTFRKLT